MGLRSTTFLRVVNKETLKNNDQPDGMQSTSCCTSLERYFNVSKPITTRVAMDLLRISLQIISCPYVSTQKFLNTPFATSEIELSMA